jgi:hypothetical protein
MKAAHDGGDDHDERVPAQREAADVDEDRVDVDGDVGDHRQELTHDA